MDLTWEELAEKLGIQAGGIRDITLMKPKKIRIWLQPESTTVKTVKTEEKED